MRGAAAGRVTETLRRGYSSRNITQGLPAGQRVELKDVAAHIRGKGPTATLKREELMVLMLDEYRSETRDLL